VVFFALQSAVLSVLLLAGAVSAWPVLLPVLPCVLALETVVLLFIPAKQQAK
jgi:hypothetical protein